MTIGLWCIFWITVFGAQAQGAGRVVETIEVVILAEDGSAISPLIQKRMQASVQTIAGHVLTGRSIEEVTRSRTEGEKLIREVFDRILIGYTVRAVDIEAGSAAIVRMTVQPWQDVIRRVDVQVRTPDMQEPIAQLVRADVQNVRQVFTQVLVGLPMDAAEWTSGMIKESLNEFLAVHLPEFRADFDMQTGPETTVQLSLYPKGAEIRDVKILLHSESIPNLLLYPLRPAMEQQSGLLIGVPTGFVERHKDYFIQLFSDRLNADQMLRSFGVKSKVQLRVDSSAELLIEADTDRYNIFVEGYLDVGRKEDNTSLRLHAGKFISPRDELYLEVDFFPHRVKWVLMPGVSRRMTPQTTVGLKYDLDGRSNIFWAKQKLDDRWLLRFEHTTRAQENEFAVRYRIHDFVALEYIFNDEDRWLRVIGNF